MRGDGCFSKFGAFTAHAATQVACLERVKKSWRLFPETKLALEAHLAAWTRCCLPKSAHLRRNIMAKARTSRSGSSSPSEKAGVVFSEPASEVVEDQDEALLRRFVMSSWLSGLKS